MNQALALVRFAHATAFTNTPKVASAGAKRAMLRHLADCVDWNCRVAAMLNDQPPPTCSHAHCKWICFQSEDATAEDMSISASAVQRVGRSLEADGWITKARENMGRSAVTFYELHRTKLESVQRPRRESKRKLPNSLCPPTPAVVQSPAATPSLFDPIEPHMEKVSNSPGFPTPDVSAATLEEKVSKSPAPVKQLAGEIPATRRAKVSNSPLLNKKNPKEPSGEPKTCSLALAGPSESDLEHVYKAFPRHVGKPAAFKAIRAAVRHLASGKDLPKLNTPDALVFLLGRIEEFAHSPAGQAGEYTPHASTWLNQQRYLDDEKEWQRGTNQPKHDANRGQARVNSISDAIRRADAADKNQEMARRSDVSQEGGNGGRRTLALLEGA